MKYFSVLVIALCMIDSSRALDNEKNHVVELIKDIFRYLFYVENIDEAGTLVTKNDNGTYVFNEEINKFIDDIAIPELCEMTSDKINLYNSYLLDQQCLEKLESVGEQCKGFKCSLIHYIKKSMPRIFYNLFHDESNLKTLREAADFIGKEMSAFFKELDMCTCGNKFFRAASRCAPYYFTNALFDLASNDAEGIIITQMYLRRLDLEAAGNFLAFMTDNLCEETGSGTCINSMAKVYGELGDLYENTYVNDIYDFKKKYQEGADEEVLIDILKKCDNLWYVEEYVDYDRAECWADMIIEAGKTSHGFYCDPYCQEKRGIFYPCCMKNILGDKKVWNSMHKLIESISRMYNAPDVLPYDEEYEKEYRVVGRKYHRMVMRWLDAPKTCKKKFECVDF